MSPKPEGPTDFEWSNLAEPHKTRRKQILEKYPELKNLEGYEWKSKYIAMGYMAIQFAIASQISQASWPVLFLIAYSVGGTCNHALSLALHELSHNLFFPTLKQNFYFSLFVNWTLGIPSAATFKRYHLEHHMHQGVDGIDVDIPTEMEGRFFNTTLKKVFFVILQPFFYALRPTFVNPKSPTRFEIQNYVSQIAFNVCVYQFWGGKALVYLIASTLLGMGLHPVAGHFISEHYVFLKGHETYSYYGSLNLVTFNVGYHNEHHDFPRVPWSRLPTIKAIAPEFYDDLPHHNSWVKVIYDYITDPSIGAFSRIKRKVKVKGKDRMD